MKDSGNEWIGLIPQDWYTIPFKHFFRTGKGLSFTKADLVPEGNAVISYGQIHSKLNTGTRLDANLLRYVPDSITENGDTSKVFKGDFIFADTSEDIEGCGNCAYIDKQLDVYAGYHSVIAHWKVQNDNKYYAYFFMSPYWRSQVRCRVSGIKVFSISQSIINSTTLVVPPRDEQDRIAHHLDKVCSDIDEMIVLQEKMIDELKVYKQSVITEAVTKGLNPNAPMKKSGVDWIGQIPEHWETHQFRRLFVINKAIAGKLGFDVLSVTQRGLKIKDITKNEGQLAQDYSKYQLVDVDDFVMNHMDLLTGYVDCSRFVGVTSPDYRVFRAIDKSKVSLSYYLRIFQACYTQKIFYHLGQGVSGMGRWRLPAEQLNLFVLPVPPLQEQQTIALYLDEKCSEIDSLISLKQTKIEELKEYKKSIIYEYVTGKKEVPYGD